jgi:hypothetical protein
MKHSKQRTDLKLKHMLRETETERQRDRELKLISRTTTHDFLRAKLFLVCKAEMQILVLEASSSAL